MHTHQRRVFGVSTAENALDQFRLADHAPGVVAKVVIESHLRGAAARQYWLVVVVHGITMASSNCGLDPGSQLGPRHLAVDDILRSCFEQLCDSARRLTP